MRDNRKKFRYIRLYLFGLITFVLAIAFFTAFGENGLLKRHYLLNQYKQIQERNSILREENEKLAQEIEHLKYDEKYLEIVAREKLGMVKPGEIIFQYPERKGTEE